MFGLLGFSRVKVKDMDKRMSSGSSGKLYPMTQLAAMTNGFCEGFVGRVFYAATAFGTAVQAVATASTTWIMQDTSKPFVVVTDATGAAADAGCPDAVSGSTRGILRLAVTDVASNGVGFHNRNANWITPDADFQVSFEVAALSNAGYGGAISLAHLGVMGDAATNFLVVDNMESNLTNAPSADFVAIELSNNQARLVTVVAAAAAYSPWVELDLTGANILTIDYIAGAKRAALFVNGVERTSVSRAAALGAMQLFGRVGHTASYVLATHAPLVLDIDAIVATVPNYVRPLVG